MPNASIYQKELEIKLKRYFNEVDNERSVVKGAQDILQRDTLRYAPRLDLVIGPYNLKIDNQWKSNQEIKADLYRFKSRETQSFFDAISELKMNPNPRYAVAIEIVFSGSSKHILGDITNASTLGLYGFVIAREGMLQKAQRILKHLQTLKKIGKIEQAMFNNVKVVSTAEFDDYFSSEN